jgi:hypothetical protein
MEETKQSKKAPYPIADSSSVSRYRFKPAIHSPSSFTGSRDTMQPSRQSSRRYRMSHEDTVRAIHALRKSMCLLLIFVFITASSACTFIPHPSRPSPKPPPKKVPVVKSPEDEISGECIDHPPLDIGYIAGPDAPRIERFVSNACFRPPSDRMSKAFNLHKGGSFHRSDSMAIYGDYLICTGGEQKFEIFEPTCILFDGGGLFVSDIYTLSDHSYLFNSPTPVPNPISESAW